MSNTIPLRFEDTCKVQCSNFPCPYHSTKCGKSTATCELKTIYIGNDGRCGNRPSEPVPDFREATHKSFKQAIEHFSKSPGAVTGHDREDCLKMRKLMDENRRLRNIIEESCDSCKTHACNKCRIALIFRSE